MADQVSDALLRQRAMSRWDDEGGAGPEGPQSEPNPSDDRPSFPKMDDAEMQALHIRVITLESLVVALLSSASEQGSEAAREMASLISPRPGSSRHPLTTHAATHIVDLVKRAERFRDRKPKV